LEYAYIQITNIIGIILAYAQVQTTNIIGIILAYAQVQTTNIIGIMLAYAQIPIAIIIGSQGICYINRFTNNAQAIKMSNRNVHTSKAKGIESQ
jgi:hypothetical protein